MTSCRNRQFLPPPSPPSSLLSPPPPLKNKKWHHLGLTPPFELFQLFYALYNHIYIYVSPSFNYYQCYGSENEFRNFYPLWRPNPTHPMTVAALATSLSIHKVLLVPLQVGANLQIRAPPLKTAVSWLSHGIQSDDSFTTYLYSPESWYLTRCWFSSKHRLYTDFTWILPPKPHFLTSEKPWLVSFSGRSTSMWNLPARICIRKSIKGARENFINTNNSASSRYLHEDDRHLYPRATSMVIR